MMHNDSSAILDDLLSKWHAWSKGYSPVPICGADPMFRDAKSGKGWDTVSEIVADEIDGSTLEAVEFHVREMQEPHRTAIYVLARNLHTGRSVWMSPRLPVDQFARAQVVADARVMLLCRLIAAGVI